MAVTDQTNGIDTGFDAAVEHGIIREHGSDADHNAAQALAGFLYVQPRRFAGHPFGISGVRGNAAVQRHRVFHHDKWGLGRNVMEEHLVYGVAFVFQNTGNTRNTGVTQNAQTLSGNERVWIQTADNDTGNFVFENRIGARRRPPGRAAWLERHIERRPLRVEAVAGHVSECVDLGMGLPGLEMVTAADDDAVAHDDGADHRIRAGQPPAHPGEAERLLHE